MLKKSKRCGLTHSFESLELRNVLILFLEAHACSRSITWHWKVIHPSISRYITLYTVIAAVLRTACVNETHSICWGTGCNKNSKGFLLYSHTKRKSSLVKMLAISSYLSSFCCFASDANINHVSCAVSFRAGFYGSAYMSFSESSAI